MILFNEIARPCVLLKKSATPDGAGGEISVWEERQSFKARIVRNQSMEARKAEKLGVTSLYTVMVDGDVPLCHEDFFRDTASGETYRITSNPNENQIPVCASSMLAGKKVFTAERAEVPR